MLLFSARWVADQPSSPITPLFSHSSMDSSKALPRDLWQEIIDIPLLSVRDIANFKGVKK